MSDGRHGFKKYFKLYCVLHSSFNENWFALSTNTVQSYKISNRLQFNSSLYFWKRFETVLHWHNFFQDVPHSQKTFRYITTDTYIVYGPYSRATLVIVYQKNAPLRYKTTCSESESRNFDCQWTLVSFLVKHNKFYQEARLNLPFMQFNRIHMYRYLCIKTCFQRVAHFEKKVCQCNNILNILWGNKEELNWSLLEIM